MTTAIIIEDEKNASEYLISVLKEIEPDMSIAATLKSVQESIDYLAVGTTADLIFSDVQLTDGLSFSIFNTVSLDIPIIFVTGFDMFMMNAFESNGIDYLLKPINREELIKALNKYKNLKRHFTQHEKDNALRQLTQLFHTQKKNRILVRKGIENISLLLSDVVFFYTENKIVYVMDKCGKKYLCDKNLTDLEQELDPRSFFRANRQYIININFIKGFKAYERVKLWVELSLVTINHSIIVSQETAPLFKKWLFEA